MITDPGDYSAHAPHSRSDAGVKAHQRSAERGACLDTRRGAKAILKARGIIIERNIPYGTKTLS